MFFEKLKILKEKNLFRDIKDRASPQGQHILYLLLIAIIGIAVYSNTFNVPFHFDDTNNIVENYKLRDLSNFWPPAGTRWFGFLTFAINYYFGGLNTTGYHIVNITIHIINAILVYWLVMLTFRTPYFKVSVISASVSNQPNQFNRSTFKPLNYLPLLIALLFVSHPIQTQAVTYIVQRFTSLATLFYLLSLVMYIKWRLRIEQQTSRATEQQGNKATGKNYWSTGLLLYCSCIASAILAMKTKEISFTLPVVITLYEFMFFKGSIKKRILYLIPILLTMLIIPLSLAGIDKPIGDAIGELREAAQETDEIPRWNYLFTQFRVIITYIRLLFLPINQNLDYDHPIYNSFLSPNVFLSFLFLLSIFGLGVYLFYRSRFKVYGSLTCHPEPKAKKGLGDSSATPQTCPERDSSVASLLQNDRKRRNDIKIPTRYPLPPTRLITFGIFWFFITLSVESSIIPIRDVIFEHRLYLPSIGIIIAFTSAIFYILQLKLHKLRISLATYYLTLATVVIVFSIATYQRNLVWQDEVSLWEDVIKKSPMNARGHSNLGDAYKAQGLTDKAIEHYHVALKLMPYNRSVHNNLGNAYKAQGLTDKAIEHYHVALELMPFDNAIIHNNLGIAYNSKGLFDKAIEHYLIALRLKPDYAEAHNNIGNAYDNEGLFNKAIEHYQIALRLKPDYAEAHYNWGVAYARNGFVDKAIREFQIALQINPEFTKARQYRFAFCLHDAFLI